MNFEDFPIIKYSKTRKIRLKTKRAQKERELQKIKLIKSFFRFLDWFNFVLLSLSVIIIILWFTVGGLRKVDGVSMYPYFHNKDIVLLYKLAYRNQLPKRGDIVVFTTDKMKGHFVKRVIALPGEEVMVFNGQVYINGIPLDESSYLPEYVYTNPDFFLFEGRRFIVPKGHVIVMGDNRPNSTDSRRWGPIPLDRIEGKVVMLVFPFSRARVIKNPFESPERALPADQAHNMF